MSVIEYRGEQGEILWKAYVSVRSRVNSSLRVQRWKFGCRTIKEAEREENKLSRECQEELLKKESQGSSWGAVVDAWISYLERDQGEGATNETKKDYIQLLRTHTEQWWKRPAVEILKLEVQELLNQLKAAGHASSFLSRTKNLIHRTFRYGIDSGMIRGLERSPAHGIVVKKKEEKKPEILTIGQMQKLMFEARRQQSIWYPIWAVALLTGMRSGELYALEWSDVDWENGIITVNKSYNGKYRRIKSTKSGDWRSVPISRTLRKLLLDLKVSRSSGESLLPRHKKWARGGQAGELRAFCMGIGVPSIKFHTLRACFATQLLRNGIAAIHVMKICGWKDLETMQRYIRLAGIEIHGATEGLRILNEAAVMEEAGQYLESPQPPDSGNKQ